MNTQHLISAVALLCYLALPGCSFAALMDDFRFPLNTAPGPALPNENSDTLLLVESIAAAQGHAEQTITNTTLAHCPAPQQAKQPPLSSPAKTAPKLKPKPVPTPTPAPTNICSPVVNVHLPGGINWLSANSTSQYVDLMGLKGPLAGAHPPANPETELESFGFKVGNLIEANIHTRSKTLMLTMIAIFLVSGVISFKVVKKMAKRGPDQASISATLVIAALATVVIVTIYYFWPTVSEVKHAVEKNQAEAVEHRQARQAEADFALRYRNEDIIGDTPYDSGIQPERMPRPYSVPHELLWAIQGCLGLVLLALLLILSEIRRFRVSHHRSPNGDMPLAKGKIFELQQAITQVVTQLDDESSARDIDIDELLHSITCLEYYLECGRDDHRYIRTQVVSCKLNEGEDNRQDLRAALHDLDQRLSDRHEMLPEAWRAMALRKLPAMRRFIMFRCSYRP